MTPIDMALEGVYLAAGVATCVLVYMGPFRFARIANWRQDVFAVRNRLWDRMREFGALDEPAHRSLRRTMNIMIRQAPVMNLFYFWAVLKFVPAAANNERRASFGEELERVADPRAAAALREAAEAVVFLYYRQLFLNSFPGAVAGWPIWVAQRLGVFKAIAWAARRKTWARRTLGHYAEVFSAKAATRGSPVEAGYC